MSHHSIAVTKRCAYKGKKGRCKRETTVTHPYCKKHTRKVLQVNVKKSTIKGAGLGLFADRDYKKNEEIVQYTGELLTVKEYDKRYGDDTLGAYGISVNDTHVIDAAKTSSGVARYACDYHGSGKKNNADYVTDDTDVWIVANRKIKAGEEIFTDYGLEMHKALGLE